MKPTHILIHALVAICALLSLGTVRAGEVVPTNEYYISDAPSHGTVDRLTDGTVSVSTSDWNDGLHAYWNRNTPPTPTADLAFEFNEINTFTQVVFYAYSFGAPEDIDIETSTDGSSYDTAKSYTVPAGSAYGGSTYKYVVDVSSLANAKYLRMDIFKSSDSWLFLSEIDVFGGVPAAGGIALSNNSVSSNAAPGTLVGNLSYDDADDFDVIGTDSNDFQVTSSTNLRTTVWMDAASKDISIVAYSNSTAIKTNDFTITVDSAAPTFIVSAEVQNSAANGTTVGTAQNHDSGATISISAGRDDLFYFDGADLKVTNSASWGGIGTTNYVTIEAVSGSFTNELVVAASVISGPAQGTVFRFQ